MWRRNARQRYLSFFIVLSFLFIILSSFSFAEEKVNADDLFEQGMQYLQGDEIQQNIPKAVSMIVQAANDGSAKAMIEVGCLYSAGLGLLVSEDTKDKTNAELALSWYERAAEAGEPGLAGAAIVSDAFKYFLGSEDNSIQEDDTVALQYFQKAAEYGSPSAINMMVAFYTYGFGVDQDPDKALELSAQLADLGDEEALLAMEENAYAYYAGTKDGVDINFATAFKYYMKLTDYNNERAMYNVGLLYEYGLGVASDHTKALEWLRKARDAGYEPASTTLAELSKEN